jgi:hypothetical protein
MKKIIHSHKETYGKVYGVLVIFALLFLTLLSAALFGLYWYLGAFNPLTLVMTVVFAVQLIFRHKLVNLILGIIVLFYSIIQLLEDLSVAYRGWFENTYLVLMIISIIMSAILIFSFLYAFKQQENI